MKRTYRLPCSVLLYAFVCIYLYLVLHLLIVGRIDWGGERFVVRSANLIPFRTLYTFLSGEISIYSSFDMTNILGNILIFAPLGLYFPILKGGEKSGFYIRWFLLLDASVEGLQWILGVGVADIDDILLNCIGFLGGLACYKILLAVFRQAGRVRLFTTVLSAAVGIPALYFVIAYLY